MYENIDVSKKFDIEIMLYHVKNEKNFLYFFRSNVLFIFFENRQFKSIKKNYWSTELEIADIVFIIRKIRHMIEFFKKPTILFIDHGSALEIVKQTSLLIIFWSLRTIHLMFKHQTFDASSKQEHHHENVMTSFRKRHMLRFSHLD